METAVLSSSRLSSAAAPLPAARTGSWRCQCDPLSSSPRRLSDLGRMYGYNPSPPKLEGIRRPTSKTALLQSRRHSLAPQPATDVSSDPSGFGHGLEGVGLALLQLQTGLVKALTLPLGCFCATFIPS